MLGCTLKKTESVHWRDDSIITKALSVGQMRKHLHFNFGCEDGMDDSKQHMPSNINNRRVEI